MSYLFYDLKFVIIILTTIMLVNGKIYDNNKIELTAINENVLPAVKYELDNFEDTFIINESNDIKKTQTNNDDNIDIKLLESIVIGRVKTLREFNNAKETLIFPWFIKHNINIDIAKSIFNEVDNMIFNTKNTIGTWTFKIDEKIGKLTYIVISVTKLQNNHVKISCDFGNFIQEFPKVYIEYVFDQTPRSVFGIFGPREDKYAFRERQLNINEVTLIKNRLLSKAKSLIAIK